MLFSHAFLCLLLGFFGPNHLHLLLESFVLSLFINRRISNLSMKAWKTCTSSSSGMYFVVCRQKLNISIFCEKMCWSSIWYKHCKNTTILAINKPKFKSTTSTIKSIKKAHVFYWFFALFFAGMFLLHYASTSGLFSTISIINTLIV